MHCSIHQVATTSALERARANMRAQDARIAASKAAIKAAKAAAKSTTTRKG